MSRAIELGSDQSVEPAQDGVRFGHLSEVIHSLAPNTFGDLGQGAPLRIGQAQPSRQMGPEYAVLGE